jgi:Fe2+ transport system protein FeoA
METEPLKPLSMAKAGQKVKVALIDAGHVLNSRLASMGILPNVEITVISNGRPGPFVIIVKDSKVVLGRGMADKIMVS